MYVRSLTGLTRRAALMATVGGLSLGPARADEAESSVEDASSTSDDGAASFGRESPSVGAPSADAPPTAAPADDPWEGSYVKPAMTVPEYIEEVRGHRSPVDRAHRPLSPRSRPPKADRFRYSLGIFFASSTFRKVETGKSHTTARFEARSLTSETRALEKQIEKNRAEAFATLATLAESLKFSQLDNELLIAPFDDVKQAAFYLPWALVKLDEDAGVKTQRAWLTFRERLIRLDAVAVDAARYQADEEEVRAAIAELESALDALVREVPARLAG